MNMPLNIDWQQILLHLLNFVVLFAVLYFLLYSPVKNFMKKREEYYKNIDDKARANLAESEKAKEHYLQKLAAVEKLLINPDAPSTYNNFLNAIKMSGSEE